MKITSLFFAVSGFMCMSCQFFDIERVTSEDIYEEEFQTIDWGEIDSYPTFKGCESVSEKWAQQTCFQETLAQQFAEQIKLKNTSTWYTLDDTLELILEVDREGVISLSEVKADSATYKKFPDVKEFLEESIEQFSTPAPAYKRGIPVKTVFKFSLILDSDDL